MSAQDSRPDRPTVAVVGGGLAGLSLAAAAVEHGLRVELFEQRPYLGGRAASFHDPRCGQLLDDCQHLAMGCCTNLADLCHKTATQDCFHIQRQLFIVDPRKRPVPSRGSPRLLAPWQLPRSLSERQESPFVLAATPGLPAPFHLAPALARLRFLALRERLSIARTLWQLARLPTDKQNLDHQTVEAWLRARGQSDRAIEQFWSLILVSALGETLDRASLAAARKVLVDGLLASRHAYELALPRLPLRELFDSRVGAWLVQRGVRLHRRTAIRHIQGNSRRATGLVLHDGSPRPFDFVVVAVPWHKIRPLFPAEMCLALPSLDRLAAIQTAPITAVHLWFDRPLTSLPNAALPGRLSQWMFQPPFATPGRGARSQSKTGLQGPPAMPEQIGPSSTASSAKDPEEPLPVDNAHYCQVVISASRPLAQCSREQIVDQVRTELQSIWPSTRARLVHWRTVTTPNAVFSVRPGLDALRPPQATAIENLVLAGDWTSTGWPSTMESAVRSGYLALEAILRRLGSDRRVLVDDLPRAWLARQSINTYRVLHCQ